MNEIQTTLPIKPTGITTTEIPLGITGTLATQLVANDTIFENHMIQDGQRWSYIDQFIVNATSPPGTMLWRWNSRNPLASRYEIRVDLMDASSNFQVIPRSLVEAQYSRLSQVSWELMFKPIKINDCRVQFDLIETFGKQPSNLSTLEPEMFLNNMYHFMIDDPNQPIIFKPDMFFLQRSINTKISYFNNVDSNSLPATIPRTYVSVYNRTRYVPNLMQADTFTVLVFARPIISGLEGLSSSNRLTNVNWFTTPYWYWHNPLAAQTKDLNELTAIMILVNKFKAIDNIVGEDHKMRRGIVLRNESTPQILKTFHDAGLQIPNYKYANIK